MSKSCTAQKMKFFIQGFLSKCDQIRRKLRIWSHLPKKSLMENFNFSCSVVILDDHQPSNTTLVMKHVWF